MMAEALRKRRTQGAPARRTLPAEEVRPIAEELLERIRAVSERAEIVGSLRRRMEEAGDIEILAVPRTVPILNLFEEPTGMARNLLDELLDEMLGADELAARQFPKARKASWRGQAPVLWDAASSSARWGTRYKAAVYRGIPVDLFSCIHPAQWGVLSLIRTGPADFARRFVTRRCRGGVLPDWAQVKEGGIYHQGEFRPIPTPEEEDVFRLLGLGVIPPSYRLSGESWPHLVYGV